MTGRPAPRSGAVRPWGLADAAVAVLAALVASALLAGLLVPAGDDPTLAQQFVVNIPLWIAFGVAPWWVTRTRGRGPVEDLGLRIRPLDVPLGLALGTALQLAVVPALYWVLGDLLPRDEVEEPARELVAKADGVGGWTLLLLMTVALAPVTEEIFYRGLVQTALRRHLAAPAAVVATAAVFALMHFQGLQLPGLFLFGLVAGLVVLRTGRLGGAIVTHVAFNAWAVWQVA